MLVTYIVCRFIVCVLAYYLFESGKQYVAYRVLHKAFRSEDAIEVLSGSKLSGLAASYMKTIDIKVGDDRKSNTPSGWFFNTQSVLKAYSINQKALDVASGTLVGIGLLGTFLGLTIGISNFDSSTSDNIQSSIQSLLDGMSTAFITSLVGMAASLLFTTLFDKPFRNWLSNALSALTNKLDEQYYIDDVALQHIQQQQMFARLSDELRENVQQEVALIGQKVTFTNEEGYEVSLGNAVREILEQNQQQTASLASFSTDLATEMNNRFSDTLKEKIEELLLPLMGNMISHIDQMADMVVKPSNEMMTTVAEELKDTMLKVVEEFKQRVSDTATQQLETLSKSLDSATLVMDALPGNVNNASESLQATMNRIEQSLNSLADDIINKQTDLLALQETTTESSKQMLQALNEGLERMESVNKEYAGTIEEIQQTQKYISDSTGHLEKVTDGLHTSTQAFQQSQSEYAEHIEEMGEKNQAAIHQIGNLVEKSGKMSDDYAMKFEVIRQGLSGIFSQLQEGLQEYSRTVQETTNQYLEEYSRGHNAAVEALNGNVQMLSELVDDLSETIKKQKS